MSSISLRALIDKVQKAARSIDARGREAAAKSGEVVRRRLEGKLRSRKNAKNPDVTDTAGNPRQHLYAMTNVKMWNPPTPGRYVSLVGAKRYPLGGNHLHLLESGTVERKRKRREFVRMVPLTPAGLHFLGSRAGGTGGIAGKYVAVELQIQRGSKPASKRKTGEGPDLHLLREAMEESVGDINNIISGILKPLGGQ